MDIIRQIPTQINDMTLGLVDDLTKENGSLHKIKTNLRDALDQINEQFDTVNDQISDFSGTADEFMDQADKIEKMRRIACICLAAFVIVIGISALFGVLFPSNSCGLVMLRGSILLRNWSEKQK